MKPCSHTVSVKGCRLCWLADNDPRYQELWELPITKTLSGCRYFGNPTGETAQCPTCSGNVQVKLFECTLFKVCTPVKAIEGIQCCNGNRQPDGSTKPCHAYHPAGAPPETVHVVKDTSPSMPATGWAYGVTTVPSRADDLLPRTLASLRDAGFDAPRLFVDGSNDGRWSKYGLDVTLRFPKIRTHGNWWLALTELYIRNPGADRYAIFQDDFVTYKNLRAYLDRVEFAPKTYWNLYTFPNNQRLSKGRGFFEGMLVDPSDKEKRQAGRGAVALVFSRDAVLDLLSSRHMVERPMDPDRGHRAVDGGVVSALNKIGYRELVHDPSLVQHTGIQSSMGNPTHPLATSFRGENFNALDLLGRG